MLRRRLLRSPLTSVVPRMNPSASHPAVYSPHSASEIVASSAAGLPIKLHYFGNPQAALRVLVVGGWQGAEPVVQAALDRWAAGLGDGGGQEEPYRQRLLEQTRLAILPTASPDGADLRRDCVALQHVESQAVHRVIDCWQPNLILNLETFTSRQKHLLAHDLELCHDVFFDIPTNPAACDATQNRLDESFLAHAVGQLSRQSLLASRYMRVSRKGSVRHGSADIRQGRNLWPLRFGIPTISIVGRGEIATQERSTTALVAALQTTVDWAIDEQRRLGATTAVPQPGDEVAVAANYAAHAGPARMIFFRPSSGKLDQVELPGRYTPRMAETKKIELPAAYAVPREASEVIQLLARQGMQTVPRDEALARLRRRVPPRLGSPATDLHAEHYAIYSTGARGGQLLCLLLEPASKYCHPQLKGNSRQAVRLYPTGSGLARAA